MTKIKVQQIENTVPEKTRIVIVTFPHVLWKKHAFYIAEPSKFVRFYKKHGGHEACLNRYRKELKAFAKQNNYPIVDLYKAMKESEDIESLQVGDGFHLNTTGDRLFAELVFKTLKQVLS